MKKELLSMASACHNIPVFKHWMYIPEKNPGILSCVLRNVWLDTFLYFHILHNYDEFNYGRYFIFVISHVKLK